VVNFYKNKTKPSCITALVLDIVKLLNNKQLFIDAMPWGFYAVFIIAASSHYGLLLR